MSIQRFRVPAVSELARVFWFVWYLKGLKSQFCYLVTHHFFFFSLKNINLGDQFLLKTFFSRLIFWTTLLCEIMPNFWWTDIPRKNLFLNSFDSLLKILLFRIHHLYNSTTELTLFTGAKKKILFKAMQYGIIQSLKSYLVISKHLR